MAIDIDTIKAEIEETLKKQAGSGLQRYSVGDASFDLMSPAELLELHSKLTRRDNSSPAVNKADFEDF